jgi:hypothetical protein
MCQTLTWFAVTAWEIVEVQLLLAILERRHRTAVYFFLASHFAVKDDILARPNAKPLHGKQAPKYPQALLSNIGAATSY